ncbi:MAG: helix-turn-helix transcriptional regulator, partial [Serratia marcescens]|nr:helix-turn-helix transcriptional regulator [Serratia marcescens]
MDINGIIGQNIKTLRQKKDWNYSQLCRELGKINKKMQTTQLRMIENGERKIACEDVFMFASVLNVSPNALMTPNTFSDNESSITNELTYIEQLPQMTE